VGCSPLTASDSPFALTASHVVGQRLPFLEVAVGSDCIESRRLGLNVSLLLLIPCVKAALDVSSITRGGGRD
jgi:hypothetical protein